MIKRQQLEQVELMGRLLMAVILLTAGISKLMSGGGFFDYYSALFQGDLRIGVSKALVDAYLSSIPYLEISLGLALLISKLKPYTTFAWFGFMLSLLIGHYVLQEWIAVNQMLGYFFLGFLVHSLPTYRGFASK